MKKKEEYKITDNDLRGAWEFVVPIEEDEGLYITEVFFYGNNKCSFAASIVTLGGVKNLVNEVSTCRVSNLNIYFDDDLMYIYDEYNNELMQSNETDIRFRKTSNDPCNSTFSHC